ncbi:DNA-3-methyladenine glycosylase [Dongia sedimenti]|uniref:Putative 3-methyladenine DNA glycosylase n=1 Tax=Dongia sedimenti TaxID=3064282 RepID=A0ABU0YTV7_9PROT|nr:DNA-3-methyladenine glycosylase [Rhodospirillaceae bacterium R-7]
MLTPAEMKIGPHDLRRLTRAQLPRETVALARFLIGKVVVRVLPEGPLAGRIVETEAYIQGDTACHAFNGMTPRNRSLFLRHGHAYVYLAYGTSWMLNVSSEEEGVGSGVLIRALEPLAGIDAMAARRGTEKPRDLLRGPGRIAQALAIDRVLDGLDLTRDKRLWLGIDATGERTSPAKIGTSTRIGLTKDAHRPLRFFLRGSAFVSGPTALNR